LRTPMTTPQRQVWNAMKSCSSDRIRKPLQQLGQECGEFQPVELLASWHTREGFC
jgi:hypothetical protein